MSPVPVSLCHVTRVHEMLSLIQLALRRAAQWRQDVQAGLGWAGRGRLGRVPALAPSSRTETSKVSLSSAFACRTASQKGLARLRETGGGVSR